METGHSDAKASSDRCSTGDEIKAALSFLPGPFMECAKNRPWEVDSDLGGRVRIKTEDDDVLTLLEKLDTNAN